MKNEIPFYKGPGKEYGSVMNTALRNSKRTLQLGNTLRVSCITDGWVKGEIIESDGRPVNWGTGWASLEFVKGDKTPEQKAGMLWDGQVENSTPDLEAKLRKAAMNVLRNNPKCGSVVTGARSTSGKGDFFVMCSGKGDALAAFNVWFDADQVGAILAPKEVSSYNARQICNKLMKANAVHPQTVDIHSVTGFATTGHANGARTVIYHFFPLGP